MWSPDGSEILFTSARNKTLDIYGVPVDLSRPEEDVEPDGQRFLMIQNPPPVGPTPVDPTLNLDP